VTDASPRFALPYIVPGQAQKETFHNEALLALDGIVHAAVEAAPSATPPAVLVEGESWIVGAGATGAWSGQDGRLALWSAGGWRFVAPVPGMTAWDKAAGLWRHWTGTVWSDGAMPAAALLIEGRQVVGPRLTAVASPSGGTTIDTEARAAIAALIATLTSHGLTE
jgi:hypothetical protein